MGIREWLFDKVFGSKPEPELPLPMTEVKSRSNCTFKVVGEYYKQQEINHLLLLAMRLKYFKKHPSLTDEQIAANHGLTPIYVHLGEINLEKEPDNQYDKNAIKVVFTLENKKYHVGYVGKDDIPKVRTFIDTYKFVANAYTPTENYLACRKLQHPNKLDYENLFEIRMYKID